MGRKTGSVNHTHMYFKRYDGMWACAGLDGCTHYMPKNMSPAPVGLLSICWGKCGKAFQLTPYNMENDKPMCDDCMEGADRLSAVIAEMEAKAPKPTGLAAFGARNYEPVIERPKTMEDIEKDEIEVIEADEEHASDCPVYEGGDCTCKD